MQRRRIFTAPRSSSSSRCSWSDPGSRRIAAEIITVFVALLVLFGAFHLWSQRVTREWDDPLIAAISLLLGLPMA